MTAAMAYGSGPRVDFQGMRAARPMKESARSSANGFWALASEKWASAEALGFKAGRLHPERKVEKPDYNFIEMFFKHIQTENGAKTLSYGERLKRSWAYGEWLGDASVNKVGDGVRRLGSGQKYHPDEFELMDDGTVGKAPNDPIEEPMKNEQSQAEFEALAAKHKAAEEAEPKLPAKEDVRVERMNNGGEDQSFSWATRISINLEDTSNQLGSNHVGPGRQLRHNTDPWPVAGPKKDRSSDRKALPAPPRQIADQRGAAEKRASKGEAASERGRAAAAGLAARKAEAKAKPAPKRAKGRDDMQL